MALDLNPGPGFAPEAFLHKKAGMHRQAFYWALVESAEHRSNQAAAVHSMMLGILAARRVAEKKMQLSAQLEERGEDSGDEEVAAGAAGAAANVVYAQLIGLDLPVEMDHG